MNGSWKIVLRLAAALFLGGLAGFRPHNNSVTENYRNVQLAYQAGEAEERARGLIRLARLQPWQLDYWETAGQLAFQAGNDQLAREGFEQALEHESLSQAGKLLLGEIYLQAGERDLAVEIWNSMPDSPEAFRRLALLYEQNGEYSQAITAWLNFFEISPGEPSPEIHYHLGLLLSAENPAQALSYLEKAVIFQPQAAQITAALEGETEEDLAYQLVNAGQALAAVDEWALAAVAFENAVDLRADYAQAWAYWGEALQHLPDPDRDPLEVLQKAQELSPESPLVDMFLGLYWQRIGSHLQALDAFQEAQKSWPDQPDIYVEQGRSTAALGDLETALTQFQKAVDLRPETGIYYSQLAAFCVEFGYQVKEIGLPAARQGVILAGDDERTLSTLAEVFLYLEDTANGAKFFYQALDVNPDYAPAHFQLSVLFTDQGDLDRARFHLGRVFETTMDPALLDRAERLSDTLGQ